MKRVGISVGHDRIHAVVLRNRTVSWHGSTPKAVRETLSDAIERLFSTMPLSRRERRSVAVRAALGPSLVQAKPLAGAPRIANRRLMQKVVRENAEAFFLRASGPLALGEIDLRKTGPMWGSAFDRRVLDEIVDGLRRSGMKLVAALPVVSALAALFPNASFVWSDGAVHSQVVSSGGSIERMRRIVFAEPVGDVPELPGALVGLGDKGWAYAGAYAAARVGSRAVLAWHPEPSPRRVRALRRARTAVGLVTLVAAATAVLLAPGVRAARFASRGTIELERLRRVQTETARMEGELRRVTDRLESVGRFRSERGGITLLLAGLTRALPDSSAIVNLRVDSLEGSFVSLATHAAAIMPRLAALDRAVSPRIVGPVTTELMNNARLERATFRFRRLRKSSLTPVKPSPGPATRPRPTTGRP